MQTLFAVINFYEISYMNRRIHKQRSSCIIKSDIFIRVVFIFVLTFSLELLNAKESDTYNNTIETPASVTAIIKSISDDNIITKSFTIFFPLNLYKILPGYAENAITLDSLNNFIKTGMSDTTIHIKKIYISGSCSVEGGAEYNYRLSVNRYMTLYRYLSSKYPELSACSIEVDALGENWNKLKSMIDSSQISGKISLLDIMNSDKPDNIRLRDLKQINKGIPYKYISRNYFPKLRYANISFSYINTPVPEKQPQIIIIDAHPEEEIIIEEIAEEIPPVEWIKKPLFAFKTNLLFDVITALNIGVEVPIGKRWSVDADWLFPWWRHDKNRPNSKPYRLEVLCGSLEGKYWFGNRDNYPVLNGWFAGVYGSGGLYDLQWKAKGYQGEFFVAGISGGYAHKLGKHFSMEYSLGIGCLRSYYRHYEAFFGVDNDWHPIRLNNGTYTWIGPTKAEVSLVWLINYKTKKGGRL